MIGTIRIVVVISAMAWLHWHFVTSSAVAQGVPGINDAEAMAKKTSTNLRALHAAYWAHHEANWNKPGREAARSWDELQASGLSADVRPFLEAQGYTVVLGIKYRELKHGTSDMMIAYPAKASPFGYIAVFMDGHVGGLTEDEFKEKRQILQSYLKKAVVLPPPKAK